MATQMFPTTGAAPTLACPLPSAFATVGGGGNWSAWGFLGPTRPTLSNGVGAVTTTAVPIAALGGHLSEPLAADVLVSGLMTFNVWMYETNMSANVAAGFQVYRIPPDSMNAAPVLVIDARRNVELAVGPPYAVNNWTQMPTATQFYKGDRIYVITTFTGLSGANIVAGYTAYGAFSGATAGAEGDCYVTFAEDLTFETSTPAGSQLFLRQTVAAGVADVGGNDEFEMWTARGSSVITAITNTVVGPVSPFRWTSTAGGPTVEWYTKPLQPFTLAGMVALNIWARLSLSSVNASMPVELAVCDGDGSNAVVWSSGYTYITAATNELGAALAARVSRMGGPDLAVAEGQRIRVRLFLDDTQGSGGNTTPMAVGTASMTYAGATVGATGDSWVQFSQTLTEFVSGPSLKTITAAFLSVTSALYPPVVVQAQFLTAGFLASAEAVYAPTAVQTYPSQTLNTAFLTSTSALYAPGLAVGPVTVGFPLLTSTATLFNPTLASSAGLLEFPLLTSVATLVAPTLAPAPWVFAAPLLTSAAVLFAPQTMVDQFLTAPLLDEFAVLYVPSLATGVVTLAVPLLTEVAALYAPTLLPGPRSLSVPLVATSSSVYAPIVNPAVAVSFIDAGSMLWVPTLVGTAPTLAVPLLASAPSLSAPAASVTPMTFVVPLLDAQGVLYVPNLGVGPRIFTVPLLTSAAVQYAPAAAVGPVTLAAPLLSVAPALFPPITTQEGGPQWVVLSLFVSDAVLFTPTSFVDQFLTTPLLTSATAMYPVEFSFSRIPQGLSAPLLFSTSETYAPSAGVITWKTLNLPLLDTGPDVFAPQVWDNRMDKAERLAYNITKEEFWPTDRRIQGPARPL